MAVFDIRSLGLFGLIRRQKAWLGPIPIVIAVGLGIAAVSLTQDAETLDEEGVETLGVVLETERRRERVSGERVVRHYVTYRFEVDDGTDQRNRDRVSGSFHDRVSAGDEIAVNYLPNDPGTAEIDPGGTQRKVLVFWIGSLGSAGVGVWLTHRYGRRCASMYRAIRHGETRSAHVTGRRNSASHGQGQGQRSWTLHWQDARGVKGCSLKHHADSLNPWPDGSEISVHLDPRTDVAWWSEDILNPEGATGRSRT
jgi:hypothetical protein